MIRLLLIDDYLPDRVLEKMLLEQVFYSIEITTLDRPPDDLTTVLGYDGVVIDERLASGVSGTDVARNIHQMDWKLPLMLISGSPITVRPSMDVFDQIARKDDQVEIIMKATAFVRCIARTKSD